MRLFKSIHLAAFAATLLLGSSSVFAQVKIGTNPTSMDPNSNLEIQASTPSRLIRVDKVTGQLAIVDGTQGDKKVLTSDQNGRASWQTPEGQVVLRAYNSATLVPDGTAFAPSVPLIAGSAPDYNASNGEYTVPVAGFYNYNLSCEVLGPVGEIFSMNVRPVDAEDGPIRSASNIYNSRIVSGTKFLEAGDVISFAFARAANASFDNSWRIRRVSIVIQKI